MVERRHLLAALAGASVAPLGARSQPAPSLLQPSVTGLVDIRSAGAKCDGVTDDSAAIGRAALEGAILIPPGHTLVSRDLTINAPVSVAAGAMINLAAGVTVTFTAGFSAPLTRVFGGSGKVAFNPAFLMAGHPEWWGAVAGVSTGSAPDDNVAAMTACNIACLLTRLQAADYWISRTWVINTNNHDVEGVGDNAQGAGPSTRIIVMSADADVIQVGPSAMPAGGPNHFLQSVKVRNITCVRDRTPAPCPADGDLRTGCSGIRAQYVLSCYFDHIGSTNHVHNFYITGNVHSFWTDCFGRRSIPSANLADFHACYFIDSSPKFGDNNGNASLYMDRCGAYMNTTLRAPNTHAVYTFGGFCDVVLTRMECAGHMVGLNLNAGSVPYSAEDLIVTECVLDQCAAVGILVNGAGAANIAFSIANNYVGLAPGAGVGISVRNHANGLGSIMGNQVIAAGGATTGLSIFASGGIIAKGNMYTELGRPIVLESANNCIVEDAISNVSHQAATAAVQLIDSRRNVISPLVKGAVGMFPVGIRLDAASNHNECAMSGVDPGPIVGGPANKLVANGQPVTSGGAFGAQNLASGIMA